MPFFIDRVQLELAQLALGEISGANEGPPAKFWDQLASRAAPKPASSAWGAISAANEIVPGILWFKTATRSGYRLSPRRQRALPHDFRTGDGWYEDTSEWAVVAGVFDRIFSRMPASATDRSLSIYHAGKETLQNWYPEKYESWFQTALDMDEIGGVTIMRFHRLHADRWLAIKVLDDRKDDVHNGQLIIRAKRGGDPPYAVEVGAEESPSR